MKWLALLAATSLICVACEKQGPLERAGEKVDNAAHDVANGGKKVVDKIEDAAEDVKDAAKDATHDIK
jgi:hypothetical protein